MSDPTAPPARFAAAARRDLREALDWIMRDNPGAGYRLRDAVQRAAIRIGTFPQAGAPRPDFLPPGRRLLVLPRLPYVLIYADSPGPPIILRILHAARDLPQALGEDPQR